MGLWNGASMSIYNRIQGQPRAKKGGRSLAAARVWELRFP